MGITPNSPMMYEGITSGRNEPNALIATSKPIPIYWPSTTCLIGKVEEEKKIMRRKISSMLVAQRLPRLLVPD